MTATTSTASGAAEQPQGTARARKPRRQVQPLTYGRKGNIEVAFLWVFVVAPWVALVAGIVLTWNTAIRFTWTQAILFLAFYALTGLGITVGFHRFFTHGAFKTGRTMKIVLALAGTMAVEGAPIRWVADHRRHHQFADEENDPHSPWRFGAGLKGLTKGLIWAHTGWIFTRENTNSRRFAPDLVADPDIRWFQKNFVYVLLFSLLLPTALGGLITWSWQGAVAGYLWAGLVRIALVHHVTWSVNSVCHVFGERPFTTGDKASNVWWLAILSLGESWHNLHHADPTCARHGVDKGQLDVSARTIWLFEKAGLVWNVRWPRTDRLDGKRVGAEAKASVPA